MSSFHDCPGRCGRGGLPLDKLACADCWFRLPVELRRRINYTWRRDDLQGHAQARAEAVSFWEGEC